MVGSMVLAALLLKLGGYGVYVVAMRLPSALLVAWCDALVGNLVVIGIVCAVMVVVSIGDTKAVVAYRSVGHMCLVVGAMLMAMNLGAAVAMYMMFFHGVVSALLFMLVSCYSYGAESRLAVYGGVLLGWGFLSVLLIGLVLNMGVPPSAGFWCEWMFIALLVQGSAVWVVMFGAVLVMACFYRLVLAVNVVFGKRCSVGARGVHVAGVVLVVCGVCLAAMLGRWVL